jgi:putative YhbY family RNA-binding protein
MPMEELLLTRDERLLLKQRAHHLNPVVLLGAAGLSDAVVKEIDRALDAHELIKIRAPGEDRAEREHVFIALAVRLGAARVQMIGKLLVLYRPKPEAPTTQPVRPRDAAVKPKGAPRAKRRERPVTPRRRGARQR